MFRFSPDLKGGITIFCVKINLLEQEADTNIMDIMQKKVRDCML